MIIYINNYLHFGSFHRHQLKTNIPYGQLLRLKRNSTSFMDYQEHVKRLTGAFLAWGYPSGMINEAVRRAWEHPRDTLFKPKDESQTRLWWALDYTPRASAIIHIVKKHWHILREIPGCKEPPQVGLRKTDSLKSLLVRSDTIFKKHTSTLPNGHFHCSKCKFCPLMVESKKISLPDTNFEQDCRTFSNCNTKFLVYLLECACTLRYIGSTQRPLRVRIQEHVSRIKNQTREAPIVQHFLDKQHVFNDLKVSVLEVVEAKQTIDHQKLLLQREVYWIYRLNTLYPNGLNSETDFSVFLLKFV